MKQINVNWILCLVAIFLTLGFAKTYASDDRVFVNCGSLSGKGDVVIWLGADKYVIPVECK